MLKVENISFRYGDRYVLRDICFEAGPGSCVAVLGNNGAGKSTLVKCINHILKPESGRVFLNGQDLHALPRKQMAQRVAYVAQSGDAARFTVFDAVLLGRRPYINLSLSQTDYDIVEDIIEKMGMSSMALCYLDELSGGELQKVMLARALAQQPRVLLLDEPTSNLDLKNQHDMLRMVNRIARQENICVVMVIHDLNLALRYCDRFLFIKDGGVYAYGGEEIMDETVIGETYSMPVAITCVQGVKMVLPLEDDGAQS